jgi:hypothetical protein
MRIFFSFFIKRKDIELPVNRSIKVTMYIPGNVNPNSEEKHVINAKRNKDRVMG